MKADLIRTLEQLNKQLATLAREELLYSPRRFDSSTYIYPPKLSAQSTFEKGYPEKAMRADNAETRNVKNISKKIQNLSLRTQESKGMAQALLFQLIDKSAVEAKVLNNSYVLHVKENLPTLNNPNELKVFLADFNRGEYDLRITLHQFHGAITALADCWGRILKETEGGDQSTLVTIHEELQKMGADKDALKEAIDRYQDAKIIIFNHISQTKTILAKNEADLKVVLNQLNNKASYLEEQAKHNPDYVLASQKATILSQKLNALVAAFFDPNKRVELSSFKKDCDLAIQEAYDILAQHRGWKEIFATIAFCLISFGTIGVANIFSKIVNGDYRFFKVKTDSIQIVDRFADQLQIAHPA